MVEFSRRTLSNGLRVLVHEDHSTPLVAVNVSYYVGSRDENPDKTGFAHLFEHLMFAGSKNVPDFDDPLQRAGGENNAFTTNDYTTFYEILPAENLETALYLESDRMAALSINKKSLDVQRKVVVEEFKETCLNEPYGDNWHHLSELMYHKHPYRWPVIGLAPEHVENATIDDVRHFYRSWYTPSNAVLSIAGKVSEAEAFALAEKWFGSIPAGNTPVRNLPPEPAQKKPARKVVKADVPVPAIYLAFRTPARTDRRGVAAQGHCKAESTPDRPPSGKATPAAACVRRSSSCQASPGSPARLGERRVLPIWLGGSFAFADASSEPKSDSAPASSSAPVGRPVRVRCTRSRSAGRRRAWIPSSGRRTPLRRSGASPLRRCRAVSR
ncbi:MAG: insulinase family protein [Chitinophagales bacterium]|nr:insulinase family protein [Chitinophagales bacterium]